MTGLWSLQASEEIAAQVTRQWNEWSSGEVASYLGDWPVSETRAFRLVQGSKETPAKVQMRPTGLKEERDGRRGEGGAPALLTRTSWVIHRQVDNQGKWHFLFIKPLQKRLW